jgi:hypothetical protein
MCLQLRQCGSDGIPVNLLMLDVEEALFSSAASAPRRRLSERKDKRDLSTSLGMALV